MLTIFAAISAQLRARGNDRGATAVEYGLMVALIAVAIILTVTALGDHLATLFDNIGNAVGASDTAAEGNAAT